MSTSLHKKARRVRTGKEEEGRKATSLYTLPTPRLKVNTGGLSAGVA